MVAVILSCVGSAGAQDNPALEAGSRAAAQAIYDRQKMLSELSPADLDSLRQGQMKAEARKPVSAKARRHAASMALQAKQRERVKVQVKGKAPRKDVWGPIGPLLLLRVL